MDLKSRTDRYISHCLQMTKEEIAVRNEIIDWIPSEIIDSHSHLMPASCLRPLPDILANHGKATFLYADQDLHLKLREIYFSQKRVLQVVFAFPFTNFDLNGANRYLAKLYQQDRSFIPFWTGTAHDLHLFETDIESGHFFGVKLYPELGSNQVLDAFPKIVLKKLDRLALPLTMHLPVKLLLCLDQVQAILEEFSNVPIILAHMGREKLFSTALIKAYEILAKYPNLYLDTSMILDRKVFQSALGSFGHHKILFGTDQPLNLLRIEVVAHPSKGARFMTDYNYHWIDPQEQAEYQAKFLFKPISAGWKMIIALKQAIEAFSSDSSIKDDIFFNNVQKILPL